MSPTLSQSRPAECQFKTSSKLKMLGPFCNQTVNLKTESKTLYYSILKLKYSPSILKQNNSQNNWHSNYTIRMFLQKHMFRSIDLPTGLMPWIILCLWGFIWDRDAGRRGNKITGTFYRHCWFGRRPQNWQGGSVKRDVGSECME